MLLQALVIGRAFIESIRQRSQQQLDASVQNTFRRHRHGRHAAEGILTASTSLKEGTLMIKRKKSTVPWRTIFNHESRLHRLTGSCVRGLNSSYYRPASSDTSNKVEFNENDFEHVKWSPVYRFDIVNLIGRLSRAKMMQTAITVGIGGVAVYSYQIGIISYTQLVFCTVPVVLALAFIYGMQYYTTKLIGVISVSADHQFIRVGHMTFWGFRKNIILPIEDVLPFDETRNKSTTIYAWFERYSNDKTKLIMPLKNIEVLDEDTFLRIFGNNEVTKKAIEISKTGKGDNEKNNTEENSANEKAQSEK